jgi:hypothetical protein
MCKRLISVGAVLVLIGICEMLLSRPRIEEGWVETTATVSIVTDHGAEIGRAHV